jgi:hypothetical protein
MRESFQPYDLTRKARTTSEVPKKIRMVLTINWLS